MDSIFKETETPTQADSDDPILLAQRKNGANWFYWIAALSLINSVIFAFEGNLSFVSGLAITQIVDALSDSAVASGSSETVKAIAIIVDLMFAALFALVGYYANKGMSWVFIVGIVILRFRRHLVCPNRVLSRSGFSPVRTLFHCQGLYGLKKSGSDSSRNQSINSSDASCP